MQHLYNVPYHTEGPANHLSRLITLVTLHHGVDIFHIRIDSLLDMDLPFLSQIFLKWSPSLDSLNALFTAIYSTQYCFWTKQLFSCKRSNQQDYFQQWIMKSTDLTMNLNTQKQLALQISVMVYFTGYLVMFPATRKQLLVNQWYKMRWTV